MTYGKSNFFKIFNSEATNLNCFWIITCFLDKTLRAYFLLVGMYYTKNTLPKAPSPRAVKNLKSLYLIFFSVYKVKGYIYLLFPSSEILDGLYICLLLYSFFGEEIASFFGELAKTYNKLLYYDLFFIDFSDGFVSADPLPFFF